MNLKQSEVQGGPFTTFPEERLSLQGFPHPQKQQCLWGDLQHGKARNHIYHVFSIILYPVSHYRIKKWIKIMIRIQYLLRHPYFILLYNLGQVSTNLMFTVLNMLNTLKHFKLPLNMCGSDSHTVSFSWLILQPKDISKKSLKIDEDWSQLGFNKTTFAQTNKQWIKFGSLHI